MRIRTIKPGFFTHEIIAEMSPHARLLFISLWCMADVAGRLEDRPKRIKIEALPYDDCDVHALLEEIQGKGFIDRYSVGGVKIIQVLNFEKHQRISGKEAQTESEYPEKQQGSTSEAPGSFTESQEGKGIGREEEGNRDVHISFPQKRDSFVPPTLDDWMAESSAKFPDWYHRRAAFAWDWYKSNSWKQASGKPIKNWRLALSGWHQRDLENGRTGPTQSEIALDNHERDDELMRRHIELNRQSMERIDAAERLGNV